MTLIRRQLNRSGATRAVVGTGHARGSAVPPSPPPTPPIGVCVMQNNGVFRITAIHVAGAHFTVRLVGAGGGSGNENGAGGGGVRIANIAAVVGNHTVIVGQPTPGGAGGQTTLTVGPDTYAVNGGAGAGPQFGGNSGGPTTHFGGSGHSSGMNQAGGGGAGAGSDGGDAAGDGTSGGAPGVGLEGYGPGGRGYPPGGYPLGPGGGGGGLYQGAKGVAYFSWNPAEMDAECA